MEIRIATRKSALALWQADHVGAALRELPGIDSVRLVPLSTRGDEVLDKSLQKIGGKGLFIKELEAALQAGEADIAVHSMKDVPAEMPDGFCIGAVLERGSFADALVGAAGCTIDSLGNGAIIGSSSLRRQAQLKRLRPDLSVEPLRGNINTRLAKLDNGDFDAIVLAAAGLERLGMEDRISHRFSPEEMLPAAGQGVIGIECLVSEVGLRSVLADLNHTQTAQTTMAERAIAKSLQANCQSPLAAHAVIYGGAPKITALVASPDGSQAISDSVAGIPDDAEKLGGELAKRLIELGAAELLATFDVAAD